MKKSLAKKITLSILAGAMLMTSSVAWAKGMAEVTLGDAADADGSYAIAIGKGADATGAYSIAIGNNSVVNNEDDEDDYGGSIAIGKDSNALGVDNIAIGTGAKVGVGDNAGSYSVALGKQAQSTGHNSVALGYGSIANRNDVVSVGYGGPSGEDTYFKKDENGVLVKVDSDQEYDVKYPNTRSIINVTDVPNWEKTDKYGSYAVNVNTLNKAMSGYYTKTEADATFVKIENNKISNNGDITFDVGTTNKDNIVTISTTGITVRSTSTHIDGNGVYVGAHNFEGAKAAMNDDGEVKGVNATFTGNVTAANLYDKTQIDNSLALKANSADVYQKTETYNKTEVDTKLDGKAEKATTLEGYGITDAYTKTEIDGMLGGSNASIAGINQRLDKTNAKINKVGAGAAALAALHPLEYDPDDKLTFSAGMGNYAGENAAALGAFYRPNEKFMVSLGGTMGNGENMVNLGLSIGLDKPNGFAKMSKRELIQEVNAVKAENNMLVQKVDAVEAENEAIKAEMAEMKALLQKIMAKK